MIEKKKNVMGVDSINIVIYTYSIHTKTHLYQISVLWNHVCFFPSFRTVHYSSLILYLVSW